MPPTASGSCWWRRREAPLRSEPLAPPGVSPGRSLSAGQPCLLVGLERASDSVVWDYARAHDHVLVTKDADFSDISVLRGFPPKLIWLRLGNCTTAEVEQAMRRGDAQIAAFVSDPALGVLELL